MFSPRFVLALSIIAVVLATTATTLGVLAIGRASEAARNAQDTADDTARVARLNCQRTRLFGPPLADFYEREHAMSPDLVEQYRLTIPRRCR